MPDEHRSRRAGDAGDIMMLGQPVAMVAPRLGMLREIQRAAKRFGRRPALDDRREVSKVLKSH
jgi:hypothetical protein